MNRTITRLTIVAALAVSPAHADPAPGPSKSLGPGAVIQKPVVKSRPLQRSIQFYQPTTLKQKGTHGGIDSGMSVQRKRGSAGSLNVTTDIALRAAF